MKLLGEELPLAGVSRARAVVLLLLLEHRGESGRAVAARQAMRMAVEAAGLWLGDHAAERGRLGRACAVAGEERLLLLLELSAAATTTTARSVAKLRRQLVVMVLGGRLMLERTADGRKEEGRLVLVEGARQGGRRGKARLRARLLRRRLASVVRPALLVHLAGRGRGGGGGSDLVRAVSAGDGEGKERQEAR